LRSSSSEGGPLAGAKVELPIINGVSYIKVFSQALLHSSTKPSRLDLLEERGRRVALDI
jgi:hypothetical protein